VTRAAALALFLAGAGWTCPAAATAAASEPLAAYLAGRVASVEGRAKAAAGDFTIALAQWPDDPAVAVRAYREAMIAGDEALALRSARVMEAEKVAPIDVALLDLAVAARKRDRAGYDAALTRIDGGALRILSPSLRAWAAWDRHRPVASAIESAGKEPVARRLAEENLLLISLASRKITGQRARALLEAMQARPDTRMAAVALMAGQGDMQAAKPLLSDPLVLADQKALAATPSLGFGVSQLFVRVGAELGAEGPRPLVIALARTALIADPSNDRARLLLAEALSRDEVWTAALAALDDVDPKGAFAHRAAIVRIGLLGAADRQGEALMLARGLAEAKGATIDDWQVYADQLMVAGQPAAAVPWYRRVTEASPALPWVAWLQYGSALDGAGQHDQADAALAKAVDLAPQEPLALNYLGYSRVEQGRDVAASLVLLERASRLAPDNASITDSLGWAYFKAGQTGRALPLIEKAVEGEPANAEINDHLGDIYWAVGRHYEARYAWRAAALTAEPKLLETLEPKLRR
jgi:Flp pilus assembly protein TadD